MACDASREESRAPAVDGDTAAGLCVSSHRPALGCRGPRCGWIRSSAHARRMGSLLATERVVIAVVAFSVASTSVLIGTQERTASRSLTRALGTQTGCEA